MKIAVINFSGNVGKSTVARYLLAPRIKNAKVIAIETINSDGTQDAALKGKQFFQLQEALAALDSAVVDIGASNVEDVVALMKQYKGSHEDFDFFVVPTVPKAKQQRDTLSTVDALADLGVPATKIRVVFNQVELDDKPEEVFSGIFSYQSTNKSFIANKAAVIHVNEIFGKLNGTDKSLSEILADTTDYKEKIKTASNTEEKMQFAGLLAIKRLAAGVNDELDTVFKALFK